MLSVILVAVRYGDEYLLVKRTKRPYKNYWTMLGGKIRLGESLEDASKRLVKDKAGLGVSFVAQRAIIHEHVKDNDGVKHSFLLLFVEVVAKEKKTVLSEAGELEWFTLNSLDFLGLYKQTRIVIYKPN